MPDRPFDDIVVSLRSFCPILRERRRNGRRRSKKCAAFQLICRLEWVGLLVGMVLIYNTMPLLWRTAARAASIVLGMTEWGSPPCSCGTGFSVSLAG